MDYKPPTREQEDAYLEQVGYSRKQLEADVQSLREWLVAQPHFPPSCQKEEDDFLIKFLVGCKGSLERSKRKLENYYTFRSSNCQLYENWDPTLQEYSEAMDLLQGGILPEPLEDGTKILCFKPVKNIPGNRMASAHRMAIMVLELELRSKGIWPMSYVIITDLKAAHMDFVTTSPMILKDFYYVIQEVMPIRLKKNIVVNAHSTISGLINYIVLPIMPKKICERFHISSSGWETVPDHIPKRMLPKEAGGDSPSLEAISDHFYKKLKAKRDWFMALLQEKTDESKRPADSKNKDLEGSFKTLQVD